MNANVHQQMLDAIAQLPEDEAEEVRGRIAGRRELQFGVLMDAHFDVSNCASTLELILMDETFDRADFPQYLTGPLTLAHKTLAALAERMGKAL
ncbi:MAG TPA: hypothetical protein VD865_02790 [Stenotrophomonas sp.]|nr:hypothetical protein [Stenotrophomonas sp.]